MRQITHWQDPNYEMDTEYGRMSYKTWCDKECKRIDSKRCDVRENDAGEIAIFKGES